VSLSWRCPECGLDYDTISPRDAALAVRTFPRRYRYILTHFGPDEDVDDVIRRRPAPGAWSALEHAAYAADVLDLLGPALRRISTDANPAITLFDPHRRAQEEAYNQQGLLDVLSRLDTACADLSMTLEYMDPADWSRTGVVEGNQREAIDVARHAVHEGVHHLREIERVLRQVRSTPPPEDEDERGRW
jgi:hypothetical protein